ncbi:MAG TPA: hypothetical protein VKF81_01735 [Blastocatellia bacterium]|nr:hypothetical protein [Blastocatellia bacterium]
MKTSRRLLIAAFVLLTAGLALYHLGSQINLAIKSADPTLWEQAPGDKWLYVGGAMMLISGSFSLAAVKIWWRDRRH